MTADALERLRALAHAEASANHWASIAQSEPGCQHGDHSGNVNGAAPLCPHPDCVLVRAGGVERTPELLAVLKEARNNLAASAQASHFFDGLGEIGPDGLPQGGDRHVTKEDVLLQRADAAIAEAEGRLIVEPMRGTRRCGALNADNEQCELLEGHSYPKHQIHISYADSRPVVEWEARGAVEPPAQEPLEHLLDSAKHFALAVQQNKKHSLKWLEGCAQTLLDEIEALRGARPSPPPAKQGQDSYEPILADWREQDLALQEIWGALGIDASPDDPGEIARRTVEALQVASPPPATPQEPQDA